MTGAVPLLFNDRAGVFSSAGLEGIRQCAQDHGVNAEVILTKTPAEMRERIRGFVRAGAPRVAVAGGDGTVHLAVQELVHSDTVLGIVPQGTANNFATALRLPMDLPSAMRVLQDGEVLGVDVGKVAGHYFTESAGIGLFADALAVYGAKANKAILRALYAITRVLLSLRSHRVRLFLDGQPHVERAVFCEAANTYRMGLAAPLAPGAKVTDGELDVVVIGDLSISEVFRYYRAMRAQMHLNLPKVSTYKAREVRIEARRRMNVHCDDHLIGTTPVTIAAQPHALKVLIERL